MADFDYRDYASKVRQIESGGRYALDHYKGGKKSGKQKSSASGAYGFLDSTWSRFGNTAYKSAYVAPAAEQDAAFDRFTAAQHQQMQRSGVRVTQGSSYLAHFAGAGGATKVLRADPNASIRSVLGEKAYKANKALFDQVKTAGGLTQWADKKMGATPGRPMSPQAAIDASSVTGSTAKSTATTAERKPGVFESLFGGISNALDGVADAPNAKAADGAEAKGGVTGFLSEDANIGANVGALAGGYFGGPAGAVVGGLLGQGAGKIFGGAFGDMNIGAGIGRAADGILGGIGRALGGLADGIGLDGQLGFQGSFTTDSMSTGSSSSSESRESRSSMGGGSSWDRGSWNDGSSTSPSNSRSYGSKGGAGSGQGHVKGESSHQ